MEGVQAHRSLNNPDKIFSQQNLEEARRRARERIEGARRRVYLDRAEIEGAKERAALEKRNARFRRPKIDAYKLAWKIIRSGKHENRSPQKRQAWIIVNALSYRGRDGKMKRSFEPEADDPMSLNFDGLGLRKAEAFVREYGKLFPDRQHEELSP